MRRFELIKEDLPRRGRGSSVSTERRYRYPAEEIWEVSDDRWQVAEAPYGPGDRQKPDSRSDRPRMQ